MIYYALQDNIKENQRKIEDIPLWVSTQSIDH